MAKDFPKKIGIFGGAFNPIHLGHLVTVEEVRERLKLDKIIFIPTFLPPHKKKIVDYRHRRSMVKLAIKNNPNFEISDIEKRIKGKSFTIETLKLLSKKYPKARFYLIIGADEYLLLNTWHEPEKLSQYATLVVMLRPRQEIDTIYPKFVNTKIIKVTQIDISSSEIRQAIKLGRSVRYKICDAVYNYIKKNKLYLE
ncbi:MAG: nicotinate (nicotinamide) nucleotide adenylyltransferase [candidate division WOR-3 bacterium]|nr:nicotinate (nicotinamide) nucleotide adenylyltransferase [candidate division WOR-3 bacterium]